MASILLTRRTPSSSKTLTLALGRLFHHSPPLDPIPGAAYPQCLRSLPSIASQQPRPRDRGMIAPSDLRSCVYRSSPASDLSGASSPAVASFVPATTIPGSLDYAKIWGYGHNSPCRSYKPPHASMQTFPRCFCVKAPGGTGKDQADNVHSQLSHSVEKDNMGLMPDRRSDGEEGKHQPVISFSPLEARISGLRNESLKIKRTELSQKLTYALIPALLFISKTKLTTSLLILSVYWQIYGFFKEIFLDYVHQEVTRKWALIYFKLLLIILAKDTLLDFDLV